MNTENNKAANYRKPTPPDGRRTPRTKFKTRPRLKLKAWPFVGSSLVTLAAALYQGAFGNNPSTLYVIPVVISGCLFYLTYGVVERLHRFPPRIATPFYSTPNPAPTLEPPKPLRPSSGKAENTSTLTPAMIREKISQAAPAQHDTVAETFTNTRVTWILSIISVDPSPDKNALIFSFRDINRDGQSSQPPVLITAKVPMKGYEDFHLAEHNKLLKVSGSIKGINEMGSIQLKNVSFEQISAEP